MNEQEIRNKLVPLISRLSLTEEDEITLATTFEDLSMDSLDMAELAIDIEDNFELVLDTAAPDGWKTVNDVVADISKEYYEAPKKGGRK